MHIEIAVGVLAPICKAELDLLSPLSDEYYYADPSSALLDSIQSIGVKYESTRNVVIRHCKKFRRQRLRQRGSSWPPESKQETFSTLAATIESIGPEAYAADVVKNRHLTSPRGGIRKSEAVALAARCLAEHGIETFQDFANYRNMAQLEVDFKEIPGQGSGKSFRYLKMLLGDESEVKPDRMILDFLEQHTGVHWNDSQTVEIVRLLCLHPLLSPYHLTPRRLDHAIWKKQRAVRSRKGSSCRQKKVTS